MTVRTCSLRKGRIRSKCSGVGSGSSPTEQCNYRWAGIDVLLDSDLGINRAQVVDVKAMGIENQGSSDKRPNEGEACSYIKDIYRLGQSLEGLPI